MPFPARLLAWINVLFTFSDNHRDYFLNQVSLALFVSNCAFDGLSADKLIVTSKPEFNGYLVAADRVQANGLESARQVGHSNESER